MVNPVTLWAKTGDSWLQRLEPKDRDMLRKLGTDTLLEVMDKARFEVVTRQIRAQGAKSADLPHSCGPARRGGVTASSDSPGVRRALCVACMLLRRMA